MIMSKYEGPSESIDTLKAFDSLCEFVKENALCIRDKDRMDQALNIIYSRLVNLDIAKQREHKRNRCERLFFGKPVG